MSAVMEIGACMWSGVDTMTASKLLPIVENISRQSRNFLASSKVSDAFSS